MRQVTNIDELHLDQIVYNRHEDVFARVVKKVEDGVVLLCEHPLPGYVTTVPLEYIYIDN